MTSVPSDPVKICGVCGDRVPPGAGRCRCGIRCDEIDSSARGNETGTGDDLSSLMPRAAAAWSAQDFDGARPLFERAAALGNADAHFFLALMAGGSGDLDGARRNYQNAAALGHEKSIWMLGLTLREMGDLRGAIPLVQRARELGEPNATRVLAVLLNDAGNIAAAEQVCQEGIAEGDPECAYNLAMLRARANRPEEMEAYLRKYAAMAVERELENEPWAHVVDVGSLSDEQFEAYNAQALCWYAPYSEIADAVRDGRTGELPRPVGDPERAEAAAQRALRWQQVAKERLLVNLAVARAGRDRAQENLEKYSACAPPGFWESQAAQQHLQDPMPAVRLTYGWNSEPVEIRGCRLLLDIGTPDIVPRVAVEFGREAIRIKVAAQQRWLDWAGVRRITLQSLADRARVTVPRAAGLGVLSLATKKRMGWSAITVAWRERHVVLEIPVEAHQLRAMFASASLIIA